MRKVAVMVVLVVMVAGVMAWGQETTKPAGPPPPNFNAAYKLDYVMAELEDGKRVNTRTYTVVVDDGGDGGRLNQSLRVPILTGKDSMQYIDVGLHLNARVRSREDNTVWLSTKFEISGVAEQAGAANGGAPTLRTVEYATPAVVTLGKSTVLASGDDLGSKKKFELSVTVTKLK